MDAKNDRIDIDIFKVVTRAIATSDNLMTMSDSLTQLLVGALDIKGCALLAINPENNEMETLASFGLSLEYLNKGPISTGKSIGIAMKGEPVVISDIGSASDTLQYPEEAIKEGIKTIAAIPIMLYDEAIGAIRLYHHDIWNVSERDLDSLMLLGETIGLAMTYTRFLNVLQSIKGSLDDIHPIWL